MKFSVSTCGNGRLRYMSSLLSRVGGGLGCQLWLLWQWVDYHTLNALKHSERVLVRVEVLGPGEAIGQLLNVAIVCGNSFRYLLVNVSRILYVHEMNRVERGRWWCVLVVRCINRLTVCNRSLTSWEGGGLNRRWYLHTVNANETKATFFDDHVLLFQARKHTLSPSMPI